MQLLENSARDDFARVGACTDGRIMWGERERDRDSQKQKQRERERETLRERDREREQNS